MLVRQAHEIEWVKQNYNYRAASPTERECIIVEMCSHIGYIFLGFVGEWKGNSTIIRIKCDDGHIYDTTLGNFLSGKRCGKCKGKRIRNSKRKSKDFYMERIYDICIKRNFTFLEICEDWNGARTKIKLMCERGHVFIININNLTSGRGCKHCAYEKFAERRSVDVNEYLERIHEVCKIRNLFFIGIIGEWNGNKTRVIMKCPCGHEWDMFLYNLLSGGGCPHCSKSGYKPSKKGTLYIQKLIIDESLYGIKFGITNKSTKTRMRGQSRVSKFDHEIFYELTLQDGQKILELENKIKEAMKGKTSYISKEDMPDGYTETVAPSELSTIMYIVKSFEKELTA